MQTTGAHVLRLCDFLHLHQEDILSAWERTVRAAPEARPLPQSTLRDHVPELLRRIAEVVRSVHGAHVVSLGDLPDLHALDRLATGFDLGAAAGELALLRDVTLQLWEPYAVGHDPLAVLIEIRRFNQAVDDVMARSVDRYARARERTLTALDRVSSAALGHGGGDLDEFLRGLLHVLLETTATADSAYLLLRDEGADTFRVRAAAGTNAERSRGFTVREGEGFAGEIARRREPMLTRDAARDPQVLNPALRGDQGVHALFGVPLLHGGEVVGVAKLASRSAYDFSDDDKHLFLAMAQRATALIVQAQLAAREREAREAVRRSEAALRHVLELTPDMLAVIGADGFMKRVNPAFTVALGHSEQELLGTPFAEFAHPEDRDRVREEVQAVLGGKPAHRFVFRLMGKDGMPRWVSFNASAAGARADSFVAVGRDVTAEREQSEFEQQLIGIVSHDLRNPLHTIVMAAAVLVHRAGSLDKRTVDSARRIYAAADRAVALIRDLLDFTRARRVGGIAVEPRPMNLHDLVRQAATEVHALHGDHSMELDQQGSGEGSWDPARLGQVVQNLVSNAFKYGAADFPVVVRTLGDDEGIRLEVHNRGTSIPPELLPHLFEPLRQGKRRGGAGGVGGVGLGLYIVDHIVRAHGGAVEVRSTPDEGTTFTVRLPRAPPPPAQPS